MRIKNGPVITYDGVNRIYTGQSTAFLATISEDNKPDYQLIYIVNLRMVKLTVTLYIHSMNP
jgi:hypothetical protein